MCAFIIMCAIITFPLMSRGSGHNNKIKYYRVDGGTTKETVRKNKVSLSEAGFMNKTQNRRQQRVTPKASKRLDSQAKEEKGVSVLAKGHRTAAADGERARTWAGQGQQERQQGR